MVCPCYGSPSVCPSVTGKVTRKKKLTRNSKDTIVKVMHFPSHPLQFWLTQGASDSRWKSPRKAGGLTAMSSCFIYLQNENAPVLMHLPLPETISNHTLDRNLTF